MENLTFKPSKSKTVTLAILSLVFTSAGLFIAKHHDLKGWLIISFFGLCSTVFLIQLLPGSAKLQLNGEGFIMTTLFRSHLTKWVEVKSFTTGYLGPNEAVLFDYVDTHQKQATGKRFAKYLSGSHGALPNTYGMKAIELLAIMNEWKEKYTGQPNS